MNIRLLTHIKYPLLVISQLVTCNLIAQELVVASYYADFFNGRKTANGEIFDNSKLTCAHKTLPFGTVLRVTNIENNHSVIVRVNDRGPFIAGRELDLTYMAASILGFVRRGTAKVFYEVIQPGTEDELWIANIKHNDTIITPDSAVVHLDSLFTPTDERCFRIRLLTTVHRGKLVQIASKLPKRYMPQLAVEKERLHGSEVYKLYLHEFEDYSAAVNAYMDLNDIIKDMYLIHPVY
ncbi:MAG: septal ring lytic transglycosylase RlpA family protein [Chitinophagales bacterium]|nr:septal ring lytic transglycosylase RlpA family protein [Chitinophagales bacterium]MDW8418648.1 septal ring lytic transglycosylase RlpA family protein [Chitinophagales bacterium]